MSIAGAGLGAGTEEVRACTAEMELHRTMKRRVLERRENFHLAFPASCHVPRAQQLGSYPSARSLVFLHEFFISGKEPLSLTGAALEPAFPAAGDRADEALH